VVEYGTSGNIGIAPVVGITADAGGSNGYRTRAWKARLATLAQETGLESAFWRGMGWRPVRLEQ
jgi:hypothetical protein